MMDITTKVLQKTRISIVEQKQIDREIDEFLLVLKDRLGAQHVDATPCLGGSAAKKTMVRNDFDCDIFVKFDKSYRGETLSDLLEKCLSGMKYDRIHGSRDYFQMNLNGIKFELVPVLDIRNSKDAENVTDMSPLHVDWITEKLHRNPKLRDEIILAKVFCKAQGLYGAESYISGLSGHVLDILVVYFGSFRKLLENAITWHKYKVIDIEGYNSEDDMNESKISPIIVIDPVDKRRNAAAALSTEKFTLFKQKAAEFIERPSAKLFVKTPVTKEGLLKKAGKNVLVMVMAEPIMSKIDVMGSKLLKVHEHILKHMALHGFVMVDSGWQWAPAEEAVSWYIIDPEILSSRREHMGPPTKELPAADKFREKHERCYENKGRLFVEVRRDFRKPEDLIRNLLSDRYVKERTIATKIFISRP